MALSEDMYKKKRLELEKQKMYLLADIRDLLNEIANLKLVELKTDRNVAPNDYNSAYRSLKDADKKINERWSE